MSGSVNKVIILGNLCADPEQKSFQNGGSVVNLRIATSERWKDKTTGERKEKAEFHNVAIFNENIGKIATQYLRKGSKVYIEGQLQTRKWSDQQGNDRYTTEIVLQAFNGQLTLLDGKGSDDTGSRPATSQRASGGDYGAARESAQPAGGFDPLDDDPPPF